MKTCKRNHTYDDSKHRQCLICRKDYQNAYNASPKAKAARKAWKKSPKGKVSKVKYKKKYPGKVRANKAKRHAAKLQRTPMWLSKKDQYEIQCYYLAADMLNQLWGFEHHIDHIIPLQGENISGLHCPTNLQILTVEENCSKCNRYDLAVGPVAFY